MLRAGEGIAYRLALVWSVFGAVVLLALAVMTGTAQARSGGIANYTNPAVAPVGCYSCHKSADGGKQDHALIAPGYLPTVTLSGPTTLAPSAFGDYTVTITKGSLSPALYAGIDIAVEDSANNLAGTLAPGPTETNLKVTSNEAGSYGSRPGELTHNPKKALSGGTTSYSFRWTAPATTGTYTVRAISNAVNNAGGNSGDDNNWATPLAVTVAFSDTTSPTSVTISNPVSSQIITGAASTTITGTAQDDAGGSGIQTVGITIQRSGDNLYWNGSTWQAASFENSAGGFTAGSETANFSYTWNFNPATQNGTPSYTITARATDVAGNPPTSSSPVTGVTVDNSGPAGSIAINAGATDTNNTSVTINNSVTDVSLMRFGNSPAEAASAGWETYAATKVWVLTSGDGSKTVYGEFRDVNGNVTSLNDSINLDTAAPTGSFTINSGAANTSSTSVTLNNSVTGATQMRFGNTPAEVAAAAWESYAGSKPWTLSTGDGTKTVYGEFRDAATNLLSANDSIILDTTPPSVSVSSPTNNQIVGGPSATVSGTATDGGSGVQTVTVTIQRSSDSWYWNEGTSSWQAGAVSNTASFVAPNWNFTWTHDPATQNGSPTYTITATATDGVSLSQNSTPVTGVQVDTTAPTAAMNINNDAAATNSTVVTIYNNASDLAGLADMRFADTQAGLASATWQAYTPTASYTIPAGDGNKTVYAQYRDTLGNVTTAGAAGTFDSITLDTSAPSGTMNINSDATYASGTGVTINNSVTGASDMRFANTQAGLSSAAWQAYTTTAAYSLPAGDGTKTVYGQYRDLAGNATTAGAVGTFDSIILDTTAPAASITSPVTNQTLPGLSANITGSASDTNQVQTVTVRIQRSSDSLYWNGDLAQWQSGAYENAAVGFTPGASISWSYTWVFDPASQNGSPTYSITATAQDTPGWTSPSTQSTGVKVDNVAPAGTMSINSGAASTNTTGVTINNSFPDATEMRFADTQAGLASATYEAYAATKAWTLPSGDGVKTVYAQYRDAAGNETTAGAAGTFDSITLDTAGPTGSFTINNDAAATNNVSVTLNNSVSGATEMRFADTQAGLASATYEAYAATAAYTLPTGDGTKTVWGEFRDAANNTLQTSDAITLDTTPPSGTMSINGGAAETNSTSVTINNSITGATQMRFADTQAGLASATYQAYATTAAYTLPAGDGTKTVYGQYRDAAGNETTAGAAGTFDSITLDTTAPTGSMNINANATYTTSTSVTINNSITGATQMRFASTQVGLASATYEAYVATKAWTVSTGDGTKTVWGEYRDSAGNTTQLSDSIILDTTGPTIQTGNVNPSEGATSVVINISPSATFTETNNIDPATIIDNNVYLTRPPQGTHITAVLSYDTVNKVVTLNPSADLSNNTLYRMTITTGVRDLAGNVLQAQKQWDFTTQAAADTQGPTSSITNPVSGAIIGGTTSYTITGSATDASTGGSNINQVHVKIIKNGNQWWTGTGWSGTDTQLTATNLSAGATINWEYVWSVPQSDSGTLTIQSHATDVAGNAQGTWTQVSPVTLDTLPPSGTMRINSDATYTATTSATLNNSVTDADQMRFADTQVGLASATWEAYATTKAWTLPAGDGAKTVWAQFRDVNGNILETSDSITLDTTAPSGSFSINSGAATTNTTSVTLNNSVTGATQMRFADTQAGLASATYEAYAATKAWTLPAGDGTKTVWGEFRDDADNTTQLSDSITLDTGGPTGSIAISGGANDTNSTSVVINNSVIDAVDMRFADTQAGLAAATWEGYAATKAWTLPAGDGNKTVWAEFRDGTGNTTQMSDSINLDTTAPSGSILVNGGATYATNTSATVDTSGITGATQMRFADTQAGLSSATWESYATSKAYTLPAGDGLKTVWAEFRDNAGNTYQTSDSITLDTTAPTGTMAVNGGAAETNSTSVTINNSVSGANQMRFADSQGGLSAATWEAYATTKAWTVSAGDGTKTVWGEYRDAAGNSIQLSDTIILDTTAPSGTMAINGGAATTNVTAVTVDTSGISGATQMRFADTQAGLASATWETYATSKAWTLAAGDGLKTIWAQFRDNIGNVYETSDSITLDTTGPSGTIAINGGDIYASATLVTVNNSIVGATQMRFADTQAGLASATWEAYAATKAWTLPAGDGSKTVWAQFRDDAANFFETSDSIILDTTAPTGTIAINAGATYATSTSVTINNSITGTPTQMRFAGTQAGLASATWEAYAATKPWTLTGGDGLQTVWGEFRDAALNTYQTSDSITLDTGVPSGTIAVNGGAAATNSLSVTVNNSVTGATTMRFAHQQTDLATVTAEPYAATKAWTLLGGDGTKTVWARFEDEAGNFVDLSDDIILDRVAPSGTFLINSGAAATNTAAVNLDSSGVTGANDMRFANAQSDLASAVWETFAASKPWTLPSGDGTKTVWAQYRDNAGNIYETSDTILLDTAVPTGTIAINNGAQYTNSTNVTINNSISGATQMRFAETEAGLTSVLWEAYATTKAFTITAPGDGTKTVWGQFRNALGSSVSTSDTIVLDTVPPAVPQNLHVTFTGAYSIGLAWDVATDAVSYEVDHQESGGIKTTVGYPIDPNYLDRNLKDNTQYTFWVRSKDVAGNLSADSAPLVVTSIPDPILEPIGGWWTEYGRNSGDPSDTRAELGTTPDLYSPNTPTGGVTPSPHGDYTTSTNKCKTCHAVHRANDNSFRLLHDISRQTECDWCHNAATGRSSHRPYGEMTLRGYTVRGEHTLGATRIPDSGINDTGGGDPTADGWGRLPDYGDGTFGATFTQGLNCYICHSVHGANTLYRDLNEASLDPIADSEIIRWRKAILRNDPARNGNPGFIVDFQGTIQPFDNRVMTTSAYTKAYFCGDCHNKNPNVGTEVQGNDSQGGTDADGLHSRPNPASHPTRGDGYVEIYGKTGKPSDPDWATKSAADQAAVQVSGGLDDCTSCHQATTFTTGANRNPAGPSDFPHQSQGHKLLKDEYVDSDLPGVGREDPQRPLPAVDQICLDCHGGLVGVTF